MTVPWIPTSQALEALFAPFRGYSRLLLAVSGGSDSMALLHLAVQWGRSHGGDAPAMSVATIDHDLRPGSAAEAQQVAETARALGLDACILTWTGAKPSHGIQERARQMRYALLEAHAVSLRAPSCAIVTAHTRDDQAETLLMRLARGSGPDGLQGMRPVRALTPGVDLVRPLLGTSRAELRSFLTATGAGWIEDPSNEDRRFERVRLRQSAGTFEDAGLTPAMLALAAERQQRAVAALEAATDELAAAALDLHGGTFASLNADAFRAAPAELRVRLLGRVLTMFGGSSAPAELAQVEGLAQSLVMDFSTRVTLGGCEVRGCHRDIRIFRERGRADLRSIELGPGDEIVWDDRFHIRLGAGCGPVIVRPLDVATAGRLRRCVVPRMALPARAAATLPAAWFGEELLSVGGLPQRMFSALGEPAPAIVEIRFLFESAQAAL